MWLGKQTNEQKPTTNTKQAKKNSPHNLNNSDIFQCQQICTHSQLTTYTTHVWQGRQSSKMWKTSFLTSTWRAVNSVLTCFIFDHVKQHITLIPPKRVLNLLALEWSHILTQKITYKTKNNKKSVCPSREEAEGLMLCAPVSKQMMPDAHAWAAKSHVVTEWTLKGVFPRWLFAFTSIGLFAEAFSFLYF